MKTLIFIVSIFFLVITIANSTTKRPRILGAKECTWGPSYWCKNLTAAASCHATKHCIQTDWIHRQLPPDNSNICQTCLDMVKQARDQLLSNETQDLIKQVFEGTCKLIHVKLIVKECDKIVDNFIPDLIDTLASEMNPQVVCSVAGLCNNERLAKALEEEEVSQSSTLKNLMVPKRDPCTGCHTVIGIMEQKLNRMSKDEVLQSLLMMCRQADSLSDACSNVVLTYFTEIYAHLKELFNPHEICLLSGECSALFHTHDAPHDKNVQITPASNIGFVPVEGNNDLPCEFCEQLVKHLRDLLVANTTEEEFKKVLEELCKQTQSFADECVGLVDEYYAAAYRFLLDEMNSTVVCTLVGICPRSDSIKNIPIVPLLPAETADAVQIGSPIKKPALVRVPLMKTAPKMWNTQTDQQLPIDLLISPSNQLMYNKQICEFCQFFLHFVQQAITNPKTEETIQQVIEKACDDLPSSLNGTCVNFVQTYEPALVALLAQEIDPSDVCPLIRACPSGEVHDVDVFMQQETGDNSKCPLCLFAVQKLEEMVKDKKTEADIKQALGKLCSKLSKELATECQAFVNSYTDELVEMLIADLNPQEVCVYLKLCTDKKPAPPVMKPVAKPEVTLEDLETNAIMDDTFNGVVIDVETVHNVGSFECVICTQIMNLLKKEITDATNEEVVLNFLKEACSIIRGVNTQDCNAFVVKYLEIIVEFLKNGVSPSDICSVIQLCESPNVKAMKNFTLLTSTDEQFNLVQPKLHYEIEHLRTPKCVLCEFIMGEIDQELEKNKDDIVNAVRNICKRLPNAIKTDCTNFVNNYADSVIELLVQVMAPKDICPYLKLCGVSYSKTIKGNFIECPICKSAVWAMEKILTNPKVDHEIEHVFEKTCRALPQKDQTKCRQIIENYGREIITLILQLADSSLVCRKIGLC